MESSSTNNKTTSGQGKEPGSRRALGRGLAALIPSTGAPTASASAPSGLRSLPIEKIKPHPEQPRKHFGEVELEELAASIRVHGIMQPVIVRRMAEGYQLIAGERRWRAAMRAGLHEVPAVVKELSDDVGLQWALIENIQRKDLDPLEEAQAYQRLLEQHQHTHETLAEAMGKSRSAITNSLRLLKLPKSVLALVAEGKLTPGHARALMALDSGKLQEQAAKDMVGRQLSVRDGEQWVKQLQRQTRAPQGSGAASEDKAQSSASRDVQERLQQALGTKVVLQQRGGKGKIEIHFQSLAILDGLLDKLLMA